MAGFKIRLPDGEITVLLDTDVPTVNPPGMVTVTPLSVICEPVTCSYPWDFIIVFAGTYNSFPTSSYVCGPTIT